MISARQKLDAAGAALAVRSPYNRAGNALLGGIARGLDEGRLFVAGKSVLCGWTPQGRLKFQNPPHAKRRPFGSNHEA